MVSSHIIDGDSFPLARREYSITEHEKQGKFVFDIAKITLRIFDGGYCKLPDLLKQLKKENKIPLNGCFLDFFLAHQEMIPKEWRKYRSIYFLGTFYSSFGIGIGRDDLVFEIFWNESGKTWTDLVCRLNGSFFSTEPIYVAIFA